jgi:flagellar motor switch protein FliN
MALINGLESIACQGSSRVLIAGLAMSSLNSVKVEIAVVLGSSVIPIHQLLRMGRGAVIELDSHQDQPVVVLANNRPVAKGEIVIEGDRIAVAISEILKGTSGIQH